LLPFTCPVTGAAPETPKPADVPPPKPMTARSAAVPAAANVSGSVFAVTCQPPVPDVIESVSEIALAEDCADGLAEPAGTRLVLIGAHFPAAVR